MEYVAVALAVVAAGAVGALVGFLARGMWANQTVRAAQETARRIEAEARARQKELILEAKEETLRLQREGEGEARAKRGELGVLERRLIERDEQLDHRSEMLESRDRKLLDRERELEAQREELARAKQEQVSALERVSGMTAEQAKGVLLEQVREEADRDAVRIAKAIERRAREEAEEKARDIVVTAIQRIMADHTAEMTVTVVPLPNDEMKGRIIGREGRNIRALEQATGVDLIIDDTPESVVLSGFDPVRREVARVALTKLIQDGRIHPGRIEEVVAKTRAEIDVVMRQAGEAAAYDAGVPGLPSEIIRLLGRLKYRTSYGQNVLSHSAEVAANWRPATGWRPGSSMPSRPTTRRSSTAASKGRSSRSPTPSAPRARAPGASRPRPTSSASRTSRRSPTASPGWRSRSPSRPAGRCASWSAPTRSTTSPRCASPATSCARSRTRSPTPARSRSR